MIGVIILNYNLDEEVLDLVNSFEDFKSKVSILVVDNYNKNTPSMFTDISVHYICTGKNIGYGRGNNVGFDFFERKGVPRVLVLNPDVFDVSIKLVECLNTILDDNSDVGAVSPLVYTTDSKDGGLEEARAQIQVRRLLKAREMWICSTAFRLLFPSVMRRFVYHDLRHKSGKHLVDSINGACFMIDLGRTGFRFNRGMFLYFEEIYLAYEFKTNNVKCVLDCDSLIRHVQGVSTGSRRGSYNFHRELQKIESEVFVYKRFRVMSNLGLFALKILRYLEICVRKYV